jgi:tetratricopeptide (TPR) repeat protein
LPSSFIGEQIMVALAHRRRSSTWIRIGCLLGLAACLGCNKASTEPAGEIEYRQGCQFLAQAADGLGESKLHDAVAEFDKAVKANPRHTKAIFCSANAHERLGETDLAIADYGKILEFDAESVDALCGRGATYLKKGLPEQAIVDLNKALLNARDSYQAWCLLAQTHLAAGKYDDAADDARQAIQLNAKCGDAFLAIGTALLFSRDQASDTAGKYLNEAICLDKKLTAQVAEVYFRRGFNLTEAKKPLEANKAFDEAERLVKTYVDRDKEYRRKNDLAINITTNPRIRQGMPWPIPADPKLSPAFALLNQKQFDEARREFTSILGLERKNVYALFGRGFAFLETNQPDLAIRDLDDALRLAPDFTAACYQRGRAHAMRGDYYQAIADTTKAIDLDPDFALAYFQRADAYCKEKSFASALADLAEAVRLERSRPRLDPEIEREAPNLYAEIYQSQARDYLDARQWEKAVKSLLATSEMHKKLIESGQRVPKQQLVTIDQQMAQAYQELGADRLKSQRWDEAIDAFKKALSLDEGRTWQLNRLLAQAYAERGFDLANRHAFPEAVADLNRALGLYKYSAQTYRLCGLTCCLMAEACHERGLKVGEADQWEAATENLNQAIRLDRTLEYDLRPMLDYARQNYARLTATPTAAGTNSVPVPARTVPP